MLIYMRFLTRFAPYAALVLIVSGYAALAVKHSIDAPISETEARTIKAGFAYLNFFGNEADIPPIPAIAAALPYFLQGENEPEPLPSAFYKARIVGLAAATLLLLAAYFSAVLVMGRFWALLPVIFLAFSPALADPTTDLTSSLTAFLALNIMTLFIIAPTRNKSIWLGTSLIAAALSNFTMAILFPIAVLATIIVYGSGLLLTWQEIDPANRRTFLYLRAIKYGTPLLFLTIIAASGLAATGWLLPPIPATETGLMSFLAQNPALNPLARYGAYFFNQNSMTKIIPILVKTLSWPGFLTILLGLFLSVTAAIATFFKNLGARVLVPIFSFVEIKSIEFIYLLGLVIFYQLVTFGFWPDIFTGVAAACLFILASSPIKSWCVGESNYFSGGVRVNISAFDKRISNQAIKYGLVVIAIIAHVALAITR